MRRTLVRMVSLSLVSVAIACGADHLASSGPPLTADQLLAGNATVRFVNLEGGCWALETSQGRYEPVGLPAQFRHDGLAVYAVAHGAPSAVSICMIAPLVTVDSIRLR